MDNVADFDDDKTIKVCRLVMNFAHEELLNQFLNNKGDCKDSASCLLKCISSYGM